MFTSARGSFSLGHISGILAGRQAGGVRLGRQDGQALGRRYGEGARHARGPFLRRHVSGILAGRQAGGVRLARQDGQALGRRYGSEGTRLNSSHI